MDTQPNIDKSELLFLYESTYSIPNGDPFTGEQRYDEETKRILVSDVRIKRFIRDYFAQDNPNEVYVLNDASLKGKVTENKDPESGAAARFNSLSDRRGAKISSIEVLQGLIDVRLFGGISTKRGDAINLTGPVQFALLNPSLNAVDLRMHQNTSVFASSTEKGRGAIGTTTVVPYALNQIHGWINPYAATHTNLQHADIARMFKALWNSVNNANTRTKSNQNSLLLLQIVYSTPTAKIYGLDRKIKLVNKNNRRDEQLRARDDYDLDLTLLQSAITSDKVRVINFYTEDDPLKAWFSELSSKFTPIEIS